ncbi:MAG: hypothetical protein II453_18940 [Alphaproteobacteria bacterium]|nr:hypothetical protein [Alphaproteobacteria bacterium]
MNFKTSICILSLITFVSGCANQEFKADVPEDYKDHARYGFGSLIKGENSSLKKYFGKSNTSDNDLAVEKVYTSNNPQDKLWNSAIIALKDFQIEFMDKRHGRITTSKAKVKAFDSTETCLYKIDVTLRSANDINVVVTSAEDSAVRLKKHADVIKSRILEEYKK